MHATALTGADFKAWQSAVTAIDPAERATVVWSPFSNLFLYHQTTDVLEADAKGVRIALGADWAPSGTKQVLGELKVADAFNRESLGGHFSDQQLCDMVTANPGDALATAWGPQIGRLQHGQRGRPGRARAPRPRPLPQPDRGHRAPRAAGAGARRSRSTARRR